MGSENFWAAKRAEYDKNNPQPAVAASKGPWWSGGTSIPGTSPVVPQNRSQSHTGASDEVDGHDVSRASHRKGESHCPECGSDGYFSPATNSVKRCYLCGFIEGRFIKDPGRVSSAAVASGPAQRAKQVANGGGVVNNYRGNINSASQAQGRIS